MPAKKIKPTELEAPAAASDTLDKLGAAPVLPNPQPAFHYASTFTNLPPAVDLTPALKAVIAEVSVPAELFEEADDAE